MSSETTNSTGLIAPISGLSHLFARLRNGATEVFYALQTAQMAAALSRMSDPQLAELGIKRSQIYTYAETIIKEDRTGA